jgi:ComEC/Rec2-related protein
VQISGRMTKEAEISYSKARVVLNDAYVVEVPLKMVKISFKTLKWQRIVVVGKVGCEKLQITNYPPSLKASEGQGELRIKNCRRIVVASVLKTLPVDNWQKVLIFFDEMRNSLKNVFYQLFPRDEAEIMSGILLGDSQNVSKELLDVFYKTGTIHLFAASGMNLILVCGFLREILNFVFKKRHALGFAMIGAVFYVFLSGFSASILRACVMFIFVNMAEMLGRRTKGFYSLGFAAGILVYVSPEMIFNLGFQLSVMSTIGVMISPWFNCSIAQLLRKMIKIPAFPPIRRAGAGMTKREERVILSQQWNNGTMEHLLRLMQNVQWILKTIGQGIWSNFLVSTCCFVMTAPLIMFAFGKINLISPLVNIFVLWMIEWIMMLGGIIIVLNWVMKSLGFFVNFVVFITLPFLFVFKWVIWEFSKLDIGVINLDYGASTISFLVFCLIIWIGYLVKKSTKCER